MHDLAAVRRRSRAFLVAVLCSCAVGTIEGKGDSVAATEDSNTLLPIAHLDSELRDHLAKPVYRFCQDKDYRLFRDEKTAFCSDLNAYGNRCPGLRSACTRPAWEEDFESGPDKKTADWWNFDAPWLAVLVKAIFWLSMGLGIVLIFVALRRQLGGLPQNERSARGRPDLFSPPILTELEDLSVDQLMDLARTRLSEGRIQETLHLSYRATVGRLGILGWVKPHRSSTSGDYLLSLRNNSPQGPLGDELKDSAAVAFEAHLLELDQARFGAAPGPEPTRRLLDRTRELATKGTQILAILCTIGLGGCHTKGSPEPPQAKGAPRGYQLFFDLLDARAQSITRQTLPVADLNEETYTVVALAPSLKDSEWIRLKSWTNSGGHLVLIGPDLKFEQVFGLALPRIRCPREIAAPQLKLKDFSDLSAFHGEKSGETLVSCGKDPFALSQIYGEGWLTLAADARFFENASLAAADNSTLALYIVGDLEGHVEFLGPWTGTGARSPIVSLVQAGFDFWVLHLLGLGALFIWAHGRRPFVPVDEPEETRRRFVEHARALSERYRKARASGWVLERYAEWTIDRLRRRAPSGGADLRSLCRTVTQNSRAAATLREALVTGQKASELGGSPAEHQKTFRTLQGVLLDVSTLNHENGEN